MDTNEFENIYNKILIRKNPNGDTRTAPKGITFEQFDEANWSHKNDVRNVMYFLSRLIVKAGENHDWTKIEEPHEHDFYNDFVATMNDGFNFIDGKWWNNHVNTERHHLLAHCPDDVNLIDVLEMVADCTCAGLARSGEVRPMEINPDILVKAVENTSKLIQDMVEVKE